MLKNSEIDLLVKMENLIGNNEKLLFSDDGKGNNEASGIAYSDFLDFINLIEKEMQVKKVASQKSNAYNKKNPEKHRKCNRDTARRRREEQRETE